MTIWALALVLLASLAGMGYRQGAIRVAFSFVGILFGFLLAVPLGHPLSQLLSSLGVSNAVLAWALGPLVAFLLISFAFKAGGLAVHRKVEFYYRYRTADLQQSLWDRLNRRVGLSLGIANGLLYLIALTWIIYVFSYWTTQFESGAGDTRSFRVLNVLGRDLRASGFAKVATSVDRMPQPYYDLADLLGTLYHNPECKEQLPFYPGLMPLLERQEFKDLLNDKDLNQLWSNSVPVQALLGNPKVEALLLNQGQLKVLKDTVMPDLRDLHTFLTTGVSPKYSMETILGYWSVNAAACLPALVASKPPPTVSQMVALRRSLPPVFEGSILVAMPDHKVLVRNLPRLDVVSFGGGGPGVERANLEGEWNAGNGRYYLTFSGAASSLTGTMEGERLTITGGAMDVVFDKD
jgi:hypothetical protein